MTTKKNLNYIDFIMTKTKFKNANEAYEIFLR